MMLGSVHMVEHLELVYWLKRLDYQGWMTMDIFPYREDGVRAVEQSGKLLEGLYNAIERVGMDTIAQVIKNSDACDSMEIVRKALSL